VLFGGRNENNQNLIDGETVSGKAPFALRKAFAFAKGYGDKDCFVAKYNNGKLLLMYHVRYVANTNGYYLDTIYAKVQERADGRVTVSYFAGKPLCFIIAMIIWNTIAVPVFVYLAWDALWNQYVNVMGLLVSGLFSTVGLFLLFARSEKQIGELEDRLFRICKAESRESL
jgi:hypothetical protein